MHNEYICKRFETCCTGARLMIIYRRHM